MEKFSAKEKRKSVLPTSCLESSATGYAGYMHNMVVQNAQVHFKVKIEEGRLHILLVFMDILLTARKLMKPRIHQLFPYAHHNQQRFQSMLYSVQNFITDLNSQSEREEMRTYNNCYNNIKTSDYYIC